MSLAGPATVQATVITDFGRPDEKRQCLTIRLASQKDVVDLGTIMLGAGTMPGVKPAGK